MKPWRLATCFLAVVTLSACGDDDGPSTAACATSGDCADDLTCRDGRCVSVDDGGTRDAADGTLDGSSGVDGASGDGCAMVCGSSCCGAGEVCLGGIRCAEDLGECTTDDVCSDDSYCDPMVRRCVPYGPAHERNEMCRVPLSPGIIRTRVQCEWTGPPDGDAYPTYVMASSLPLVIDFGIARGPDDPRHPSIVVVTGPADGGTAIIRILDGTTCEQLATLDDPTVIQGSGLAAGDLDGDGRAEIVAPVEGGGDAAWTYDDTLGAWRLLWRSEDTTGASQSRAISLADLDDDGVPEVIDGAVVRGADGVLLTASAGVGDVHCGPGSYVTPAAIADVDLDGQLEIALGSGVLAWDAAAADLVVEPYFTGAGLEGAAAVADFGEYPGAAGDAPGRPEIAIVRGGTGALLSVGGDVVFGPVAFPGTGDGGNPTIADFDGDGRAEFATAGFSSYTVFDPDCLDGASRGGECASMRTDGILWTQPIQENSCAIMGSTVFDFEADGSAEVVYADECYARIFSGHDGTVLWSRRRSSATWIEGPTIADVDGDFHAEMVLTATDQYRPSCPGIDPLFPGLRCLTDDDCPSALSTCVASLCRCTSDDDCGDAELTCTDPIAGTDGEGNVCRSTFAFGHGVRVYGDITDRWAGSRPIWNQHAYSVTNVDDDGHIPRSSEVLRNWEDPRLNNFRQNVQGGAEGLAGSDITVAGVSFGRDCTAEMPVLPLTARACSRGPLGVGAGIVVVFYDGDPAAGGREVCRATTTRPLRGGECEQVSCDWAGAPVDMPITVHIRADADGAVGECLEGNNGATLEARCPPPFM